MKSMILGVWIGLLCVALLCIGAGKGGGGGAKGAAPTPPTPTVPDAQQKVEDASTAVTKARDALNAVVGPLRKAFEATPEYSDASKAFKDAQVKYDAAKAAALVKVQSSPDYAAAAEAKHVAEQAKEAVAKDEGATMEQKTAALNAVMEQGKAVSKLETDALAADADFHDAKQKMVDAKAAMDKLMAGFEATIKDKPEWQAAKAAVDTAEADVKKAKDDLVAAQQADAQAAADYQTQLAAWQKSGGGGGGGPKMPKVSK